jgi:hypothetical protein
VRCGAEPQPQPTRTDGGKIKLAEGVELTEQELRDLVAHKAQTDSQKLSTPQPGEYKLEFPHDYVLPQGVEWRWNEADPLLAQAREFASASGMTQDTFSKLLGLHAASQMKDMQEFAAAKAAEVQKLGDTANARVDAVKTWLKAMAPDHFAGLARVLEMAPSAATVKGLEALMHRYTTQGAGGFNDREPIIPGKLSDAEYGKLTYAERIEYASKFPDHGPLPPSASEPLWSHGSVMRHTAALRRYLAEKDEWLRETGGRPHKIALNSVDARSILEAGSRRYSPRPSASPRLSPKPPAR